VIWGRGGEQTGGGDVSEWKHPSAVDDDLESNQQDWKEAAVECDQPELQYATHTNSMREDHTLVGCDQGTRH
jgi:hypothetical protein